MNLIKNKMKVLMGSAVVPGVLCMFAESVAISGPRDFLECRFYDQGMPLTDLGTRNYTTDSESVRSIQSSFQTQTGENLYSVIYSGSLENLTLQFCVNDQCTDPVQNKDAMTGIDLELLTPSGSKQTNCFGYEG